MKITKKHKVLTLIAVPVVALAVGGVIYAMPDKKEPAQLSTQPTSAVTSEASTTNTQPTVAETQVTAPSQQTVAQEPAPAPTPPPQPDWGEDPNTPGMYKVFNKTAVMDAAGIDAADREFVDKIAQAWYYKGNDYASLCGAYPRSKMSTIGADYDTNPVTQLKWCNASVKARYGSWETAYNFWVKNKYI